MLSLLQDWVRVSPPPAPPPPEPAGLVAEDARQQEELPSPMSREFSQVLEAVEDSMEQNDDEDDANVEYDEEEKRSSKSAFGASKVSVYYRPKAINLAMRRRQLQQQQKQQRYQPRYPHMLTPVHRLGPVNVIPLKKKPPVEVPPKKSQSRLQNVLNAYRVWNHVRKKSQELSPSESTARNSTWAQRHYLQPHPARNRFRGNLEHQDLREYCKHEDCKPPLPRRQEKSPKSRKSESDTSAKQTIVIKVAPVLASRQSAARDEDDDSVVGSSQRMSGSTASGNRRWQRKRHRPVRRRYFVGTNVLLLGMIPILLIGGLGLGYVATQNNNDQLSATTVININGTTLTNTFTPTNTATATNNDDDTITINTGRSSRARSVMDKFYHMLGTSPAEILPSLYRSTRSVTTEEVSRQSLTVARKVSCLQRLSASEECANRVVCDHFGDEHLIYSGNLLLRAAELFVAAISHFTDVAHVADLWHEGGQGLCEQHYGRCDLDAMEECLMII